LFSHLLFNFELTSQSDLTWTRLSDGPFFWDSAEAWQHGLIDGDTGFLDKKSKNLLLGLYSAAWNWWELPGRTALTFLALSN
jgi:hypothetical protein